MLLLCKDLQAIGSLKKHHEKKHSLLSLICLSTKMATRNFLIPQRTFVAKKNGVINGSWQELLAQIFPLHCRLIPESFMLMCSKLKTKKRKNEALLGKNRPKLAQIHSKAAFFAILAESKFHGGLPSYLLKTISPL